MEPENTTCRRRLSLKKKKIRKLFSRKTKAQFASLKVKKKEKGIGEGRVSVRKVLINKFRQELEMNMKIVFYVELS